MAILSAVVHRDTRSSDTAPVAAAAPREARSALELQGVIAGYRSHGYRAATIDPLAGLASNAFEIAELNPAAHGLSVHDEATYNVEFTKSPQVMALLDVIARLQASYCGTVSLSCEHIREMAQRQWLYSRFEQRERSVLAVPERCTWLLQQVSAAEAFEHFLTATYPNHKRFSLEGCESLIPLLNTLIERGARLGVDTAVIGMAHRGRLNVLRNVLDLSGALISSLFNGDPDESLAAWDLREHLGHEVQRRTAHGDVTLLLAHNPSHLESVCPVVCGMARALQERKAGGSSKKVLSLLVHGDAAFSGQGIVMETLNLSQTRHYHIGGTVHVVLNNQIGSTVSNPRDLRSTLFCADAARSIDAPIIRVNADDPDAVWFAGDLAVEYRDTFSSDIVIEIVGYRRYGHAGGNDSTLTQPAMQRRIRDHRSVVDVYAERLTLQGLAREGDVARFKAEAVRLLLDAEDAARVRASCEAVVDDEAPASLAWDGPVRTGVPVGLLQGLLHKLATPVPGFSLHPEVQKAANGWLAAAKDDRAPVDWRLAENLAYASLLAIGFNVRVSGLDVGRGSFFHRLAVWHDQACEVDGAMTHVPLRHIADAQGHFSIADSPLSEEAVLGFEYGYALRSSRDLVIWEAQLGDFVNNAQVVIDQYITTGEAKWGYAAGLVVLLPHGHEGAGPEHSSAFIGRFLQLCAGNNVRVAMPSTPAQLYHLLRRQALVDQRKPLIVMTPKTWLYGHAASYSTLHDLADKDFRFVIADSEAVDPDGAVRAVVTSGKLYYDLAAARGRARFRDIPILRVEQLYPFPTSGLAAQLAAWPRLREVVWAQEEAKNHGAWYQIRDELEAALPPGVSLIYAGRSAAAPSAVCHPAQHIAEQRAVVADALGLPAS
jgi:2-oxoglutarate dehydrogenase E1 component